MASPSSQFAIARKMGIYDPLHQISMWEETFEGGISPITGTDTILQADVRLDNKVIITEFMLFGFIQFLLVLRVSPLSFANLDFVVGIYFS